MKRTVAVLAYAAAGLTILAAMLTPFLLMPLFVRGVAALGLHIDPVYSGGGPARTIQRSGYRIVVNQRVAPAARLSSASPFVQIAWEPASALPARVADAVDIDGDGRPELEARFVVPRDLQQGLRADVLSLSSRVVPVHGIARQSFACAIVRVGDRIVLRAPLRE